MTCARAVRRQYTQGLSLIIAFLSMLCIAGHAQAHEYWLDPVGEQWQVGQMLIADIRNGENFIGTAYPFDNNAIRFGGLVSPNKRRALSGRLGDYPAINFKLEEPGLHLLLLETTARQITYEDADKFQAFLEYHDLQESVEALSADVSTDARTTQKGIRERYYRFVKALVNVSAAGSNNSEASLFSTLAQSSKAAAVEPQGQRLELLVNALSDSKSTLEAIVLFEGQPLAGRQIELFHLADKQLTATRTVAISDANGAASFDIGNSGDYLLNSVWIARPQVNDTDWETFWASLTFSQ